MSNNILIAGSVIPTTADTPLDARARIQKLADLTAIEMPFVGMEVYCLETARKYRVLSLKNKIVNGVAVANMQVDKYETVDGPKFAVIESLSQLQKLEPVYIGMPFYVSGKSERGAYMIVETDRIIVGDEIRTVASKYVPLFTNTSDEPGGETSEKMYYGYVNDGVTYQVVQITEEMLTGEHVTESGAGAKTATLNVPAGAVLFVLVPKESGLTVLQDDGVGGKVPFAEDNGASGTGANGAELTLGGTVYKAYGEFNLVDAETIIYITGA